MKYILKALKQKKVMPNSKSLVSAEVNIAPKVSKNIDEELIGKAVESKAPVVEEIMIGAAKDKKPALDPKFRASLLKQYDEDLGIIRDKLKRDAGKPAWDSSFNEYKKIMEKVNNVFDSK